MTLWHSYLIFSWSSMKMPPLLSSLWGSWLHRGSLLRTVPGHLYKELAWFPPVNSHLSSSLLTALLFYPRDCPSWIKCSLSMSTLWRVTHCCLFRLEALLKDWRKQLLLNMSSWYMTDFFNAGSLKIGRKD